jgi:hypothetical protein
MPRLPDFYCFSTVRRVTGNAGLCRSGTEWDDGPRRRVGHERRFGPRNVG